MALLYYGFISCEQLSLHLLAFQLAVFDGYLNILDRVQTLWN